MRLAGDWIDRPATQAVFDALGAPAWFVGGCVRNAILGETVDDIDIATALAPDDVVLRTKAAGLKPVPTGIDHGTVTVVSDGVPHEVTTFRRDVATDGRRATVAFAETMDEDAARRDFTINALYADRTGRVSDPLGQGLADLDAREVRFIGDAGQRIEEDYLRILRYFRFLARIAAAPGTEALAAIAAHLDGLDRLSRERIGHEMRKLLAAPDPSQSVATMASAGVLARVLPGAATAFLAPLVHVEGDRAPDWLRRLAAMGGEDAADRLRLSRAEAQRLATLTALTGATEGLAEIAWREGADTAWDVALLRAAAIGALPPDAAGSIATGTSATFPVTAADLMPALEGPALGTRLKELERRWIASGFALDRDALLRG